MLKYGELKCQLDGIKHAVKQIEYGIKHDSLPHIAAELNYLQEKVENVVNEATIVLQENEK